jgi:hypothetical protein
MSLWTKTSAPKFAPHAVPGIDGWVHPVTNEILETFGSSNKPSPIASPVIESCVLYRAFIAASGDVLPDLRTSFHTGDYLTFAVRFDAQVTVVPDVGSPYLKVTINGVVRNAVYVQTSFGLNTATLLFVYQLQSSDAATPGNISVDSQIHLSGHIYKLGTTTPVTITGIPRTLLLSLSGVQGHFAVNNAMSCGIGSAQGYVVGYTPSSSTSGTLIVVETAGTFSTSGTAGIHDITTSASGILNATNTQLSDITISSTVPGNCSVAFGASAYDLGAQVVLTATFDRPITVTGTPNIVINVNGSARTAGYASGSTTDALVFNYTVVSGDHGSPGTVSLVSPINLNGGTLLDASSLAPSLTFTQPAGIASQIIDGSVPTFAITLEDGIHFTNGGTSGTAGMAAASVIATFNKPVTLILGSAGTTGIELQFHSSSGTGAETIQTRFASAGTSGISNTTILTFNYTITGSDKATAGGVDVVSPVLLHGGASILDDAGNAPTSLIFTPPATTNDYVN